ncbi:MAG: nucleotidyl transferase AbiEii/AbiGii toxin family protein [bacterium]|nr:nucleotidyl transferase AbiEii/AbiGii toxin family protein [bacterium]
MAHESALTEKAKKLFPRFGKFSKFYLVGGTSLALQIGHRVSVDFDLFSEEALPTDLVRKVRRTFPDAPIKTMYRVQEQLNILIDGIKTTFFHYPYPLVEEAVTYKGVRMASVSEIAAMKAFAIGKRLSYKDYVDWYFLLSEKHVGLEQVIEIARKKFDGDFNARLFLGQLVSIADVKKLDIDFLRDPVDDKTIEKFLAGVVRKFRKNF